MKIHNALGLNYEVSDLDYYRKVLIKMYWDDSTTPNVIARISAFFCLGHSMAAKFSLSYMWCWLSRLRRRKLVALQRSTATLRCPSTNVRVSRLRTKTTRLIFNISI